MTFKQEHDLEKRKADSTAIRQKYPDRVPVVVEKVEHSKVSDINKIQFLVPADITVGQFVHTIRKRIVLPPEKAMFVFVDNILPPISALMSTIDQDHKDEDGYLYFTYSGENTFGCH